jgi:hypothetical protein
MKWIGAGISEVTHKPARRTLWACGPLVHPLSCVQCQKFLNIAEKIILNFQGIWRTFIFWSFFIARIIQKIVK